jgi:hypothetical protein
VLEKRIAKKREYNMLEHNLMNLTPTLFHFHIQLIFGYSVSKTHVTLLMAFFTFKVECGYCGDSTI